MFGRDGVFDPATSTDPSRTESSNYSGPIPPAIKIAGILGTCFCEGVNVLDGIGRVPERAKKEAPRKELPGITGWQGQALLAPGIFVAYAHRKEQNVRSMPMSH